MTTYYYSSKSTNWLAAAATVEWEKWRMDGWMDGIRCCIWVHLSFIQHKSPKMHLTLRNVTLCSVIFSLVPQNPRETYVLSFNLPPCCHSSLSYDTSFDIQIIHQRMQTIHLHALCCHHYCEYCNVDFLLSHNVTCYTNSLSSNIHVMLTLHTSLIPCTWKPKCTSY